MSTEAILAKLKKNNIAEQALKKLEPFTLKLSVLPKFLKQATNKDPNYKTSNEQKKSDAELLEELRLLPEFSSDFELLQKHHNRRTDNLYKSGKKYFTVRSSYEYLIRAASSAVFKHIRSCISELKPIDAENNYFYVLYHLRDSLLNYWHRTNKLLDDKNQFNTNLQNLYSESLQIQMLLEGFKKTPLLSDLFIKTLNSISHSLYEEQINHLEKLIDGHKIQVGDIQFLANRSKEENTAVYPTGNITTANEFENYQKALKKQKAAAEDLQDKTNMTKASDVRAKYQKRLGIPTPPTSPALKPAVAPPISPTPKPSTAPTTVYSADNPTPAQQKRHNYTM